MALLQTHPMGRRPATPKHRRGATAHFTGSPHRESRLFFPQVYCRRHLARGPATEIAFFTIDMTKMNPLQEI